MNSIELLTLATQHFFTFALFLASASDGVSVKLLPFSTISSRYALHGFPSPLSGSHFCLHIKLVYRKWRQKLAKRKLALISCCITTLLLRLLRFALFHLWDNRLPVVPNLHKCPVAVLQRCVLLLQLFFVCIFHDLASLKSCAIFEISFPAASHRKAYGRLVIAEVLFLNRGFTAPYLSGSNCPRTRHCSCSLPACPRC